MNSQKLVLYLVLGAFCVGTLLSAHSLAATQGGDEEFLNALCEGYLANRAKFDQFTCRFRIEYGKAASIEDALSTNFAPTERGDGFWAVDGEREFCQISTNDGHVREQLARGVNVSRMIASIAYLNNGTVQATHSQTGYAVNLYGEGHFRGNVVATTPFSLGVMGEGEDFDPADKIRLYMTKPGGKYELERDGGGGMLSVILTSPTGKITRMTFDQSKGFLLVGFTTTPGATGGGPTVKLRVVEARRMENGGWFPWKSVNLMGNAARMIETASLSLDKPRADEFAFDVPKGTFVRDDRYVDSQYMLAKGMHIDADNLNILLEQAHQQRNGIPSESPSDLKGWILAVSITVLAALALVGMYIFRRRRMRN